MSARAVCITCLSLVSAAVPAAAQKVRDVF